MTRKQVRVPSAQLIGATAAAKLAKVSKSTIGYWVDNGLLDVVMEKGRVERQRGRPGRLFDRDAVIAAAERQGTIPRR